MTCRRMLLVAGFTLWSCAPTQGGGQADATPKVLNSKLTLQSRAGCLLDADCAVGLFCAQNRCTFECAPDAPCAGAGETCSVHGRCVVPGRSTDSAVPGTSDEAQAAAVPTTQPSVKVLAGVPGELQVPPGAPFVTATITTAAPVPEGAISYRVMLDGQTTVAPTLRATGTTAFTLSIPTGAAGTLDAEPRVQQASVVTSVGGYTVTLAPRRAVDGVYTASIAVREFGGSELPLRFGLRVVPQGATWSEATERYLLLPVASDALFSPVAAGPTETWLERPLEWDDEGQVYFARFAAPFALNSASRFSGSNAVVRSLRVEIGREEEGRFTGALVDRWQGLFAARTADGVQTAGSVALSGTFLAARNSALPVAARGAPTASSSAPSPVVGQPLALSACDDATFNAMVRATLVATDAGVSSVECPNLSGLADFRLAPPEVRASCALRLADDALAGPTTAAQVRAFLDQSTPNPGGLSFAQFLERCAAQDGYCVATPEVLCTSQLLAYAYQTQGPELARAGELLARFQVDSREAYLGRQLAAFQVDTNVRLDWLRTSEAPLFLASELRSYNEDLLNRWKSQVLDAHFAVLGTQFAPAGLEVLARAPTDATALSVRGQMLLELSQSWQGAMDALQIAAQRWNALYQDDVNRAAKATLVRAQTFDLYLAAAVLSQLNRAAGVSAFSSVFGSGFTALLRSQEELGLPFNDRLFMRDAEVTVSRSVDPSSGANTLLADREELARRAVRDAQESVDRVLVDAHASELDEAVLTDRLITQAQELQSELIELCGLPLGCSAVEVGARPECAVNTRIGGCGFAVNANTGAVESFDQLLNAPSISQAGQAVLAYRQSLIEYQQAEEEFRGNQEKADIELATAEAFAEKVRSWDAQRRAVAQEITRIVDEIGSLRADAYEEELTNLRAIQQRRAHAYEVQAANVAEWNQIRTEGITRDMKRMTSITALQQTGEWLSTAAGEIDHLAEATKEGFARSVGTSTDISAPARLAVRLSAYGATTALRGVQRALESAAAGVELTLQEEQARRDATLENLADLASLAQLATDNELAALADDLRLYQAKSDLEIASREALIDALRRNQELDHAHERDLVELRDRRDAVRLRLVDAAHLRVRVLQQEIVSSRKLMEYLQLVQRAQLLDGRAVALQSRLNNLTELLGSPAVIFAFANRLARAESRVERARTLLFDWLVALEYYAVRPFIDQRLAIMLARNPSQLEAIANELVRLQGVCGGNVNTAITELSLRDELLDLDFDTETQTRAERFRAVLARGNVPIDTQTRYSTDERVGQLLTSRKVLAASFALRLDAFANLPLSCNAKLAGLDVQLVGEGLGRGRPVVSVLYDGTSTLRSCQPNIDTVVGALAPGSTNFGSMTRLRTAGRSVSPLATVNGFGAADSLNRGLEGLPLASTYTLLIDPSAGENGGIDWSKLDDVRLKLVWAYQDVFPAGQCQ